MLTLVHDKDVYREGYDEGYESRQAEVDTLNATVAEKTQEVDTLNATIAEKDDEIKRILNEFEEYKRTHS